MFQMVLTVSLLFVLSDFCTDQFLYWPKRIYLNLFPNEHAIYVFFLSIGGSISRTKRWFYHFIKFMCFNTRMLYSNLWRYYTEMRITSSVLEMYKDFRCLCKLRIYFKNQLKNLARFQSRINNCIIMTWHLVNLEAQFQSHCPIW